MDHPRVKPFVPATSRLLFLLLVFLICLPAPAEANVGLPVIVPMGLMMIVALLPIIGIEVWVLSARLELGFGTALAAVGAANAVSTIIGIPFGWFFGGIGGKMIRGFLPSSNAAWKKVLGTTLDNLLWVLPGDYHERNIGWIMPAVILVLLIPCFFLSWWLESIVAFEMLEGIYVDQVDGAVFLANLISYGVLGIVPIVELTRSRKTLRAAIQSVQNPRIIHEGVAPDGRLITADQYGTIRFLDAKTGELLEVLDPPRAELFCEAVSPDGRFLFANDENGYAIWNNASGQAVFRLQPDDYFSAVAFSPNCQYLAAVSDNADAALLWSCETGELLITADTDCGYSIAFSSDSRMVTSGDKTIFIYGPDSWELSKFLAVKDAQNAEES